MSVFTLVLVTLALLLPIIGALALRLLTPRLSPTQLAITAALIFGTASLSVVALSPNQLTALRVGGLTLLQPASVPGLAAVPLPPEVGIPASGTPQVASAPTRTPFPTPTRPPTATPLPTDTPPPTATATPSATPAPPTPTPEPRFRVVNAGEGGLRVRPEPNTAQAPIKNLPDGTIVTVTGADVNAENITWRPIRDPEGTQGWVSQEFLEPVP